MKIQLLLTGNELMTGHTVDSNSAMIAELIAGSGHRIQRKVTIGDDLATLVTEMRSQACQCDVLIVNGGLGPTVDDLTAQALSHLSEQPLLQHPQALSHLQQWCDRRKLPINDANLKQTMLPCGVDIIPNATGSAVGFSLEYHNCLIICTPGVPSELRLMMEQSIAPLLANRFPISKQISTLRFQTFGIGESTLQQMINNHMPDWPAEVELGFRVGSPLLEIKLTIQQQAHKIIQQQCFERLQTLMGDYIIGLNSCSLAESIIELLQKKRQTLTIAESCTGGLIAASITEIAGASTVFQAGFVTYSNAMKQQLLGVDERLLSEHGAVSAEVVTAMAQGALQHSAADYAIAVSGIAGPDGGSREKPVGTVWIAWGNKQQLNTQQLLFNAPRKGFQQIVSATSLDLLRRELLAIKAIPRYFHNRAARN
jgi:nicotinamide-nucleotide amidase